MSAAGSSDPRQGSESFRIRCPACGRTYLETRELIACQHGADPISSTKRRQRSGGRQRRAEGTPR